MNMKRKEKECGALQKFLFSLCLIVIVSKRHNNSNTQDIGLWNTDSQERFIASNK
jgi:hypothetical protein